VEIFEYRVRSRITGRGDKSRNDLSEDSEGRQSKREACSL